MQGRGSFRFVGKGKRLVRLRLLPVMGLVEVRSCLLIKGCLVG